jgi:hypothetical protein
MKGTEKKSGGKKVLESELVSGDEPQESPEGEK